jgi:hypothetical protein
MKLDTVVIESHPPGERPFRLTTCVVYIVFAQFKSPRGGEPRVLGVYASWEGAEKYKKQCEWTPDKGDRDSYGNVFVRKIELEDTAVREPI